MDAVVFDRVTLQLCRLVSRRATVGGLGLAALILPGLVDAKKRKRKNKKRQNKKRQKQKQLITFNDYGCVNVGGFCQNNEQCCSSICQGENDQKTCQGHNTSACQGEDGCGDDISPRNCTTVTEAFGSCHVTTGHASYCGASVRCHACAQDADCVSICGAGAACVVCADSDCRDLGYQTACASTVTNGCYTTL